MYVETANDCFLAGWLGFRLLITCVPFWQAVRW